MKHLFKERKEIEKKIDRAKGIFLACDFDGTLVDIKPTPQEVKLPLGIKNILSLLSKDKKFEVGIISGRALPQIKKIVGLPDIFYAGNHGFEIKLAGEEKFVHPQLKKAKPLIKKLAGRINKKLKNFQGILVENKIYSLSVHYRNCLPKEVPRIKREVENICLPFVKGGALKLSRGKKVIEIRPGIIWNKGEAFFWIRSRLGRNKSLTIYIGDDKTDEDVFLRLKKGLGVYVGRKKKNSAAGFYLSSPKQVEEFLIFLTGTQDDRIKKSEKSV